MVVGDFISVGILFITFSACLCVTSSIRSIFESNSIMVSKQRSATGLDSVCFTSCYISSNSSFYNRVRIRAPLLLLVSVQVSLDKNKRTTVTDD